MSFGFGGNNNNTSTFGGFGGSNTNTGFGANNASSSGSLFGGNTATAGGFGGFGSSNNNNSSPFGQNSKPAFGASTSTGGGGLFGGNTNNTATSGGFGGGGGFGNTSNTGGFGGNSSGGLFGQNKPAATGFGASNTGGSLFGGGGINTNTGFGASSTATNNSFGSNTNTNTNSGFGASNTGSGFTFGGGAAASTGNNNNGTANPPFNAVTEKEQGTGGASNTSIYQSITFMDPYKNKSFEELRTEDYAQGRRYGNTNGQAGGFGQSTGFGGFNATNTSSSGGLFGNNNATSGTTGFGANNSTNTNTNTFGGFGASNNNNSSGLFGNKPAGGGLFGAQSSASTTGAFGATAGSGGGLFGGGNNAFGNNTNTNTGGGLFGANNQQQQQNKPAFGGFGSTNTSTGFGAGTNTGGGLFGNSSNSNTGGGLFGQQNQQPQQQQQSNPFGASNTNTGGGLFGNQNKPASGGLFGNSTNNTNTGGGLFGAQNNQQQNNPFGQSTNTGGGLFGAQNQNQNKPAGGGLFGNSTNTGGGLFGNQNNQNTGGGLFGGSNTNTGGSLFGNQNKPAGGSLFGNNTNTSNTGSGLSLFGNSQQNQQNNAGSSLFGGQNQNQQSTNTNSLFGGSFNQSQPQQNQLHASLTGSPYGNEQLFSSLAAPSPPVGPLATPLSGAKPAPRKTPSLLASARVNTPVYSPRGSSMGRNGGYGFSYSTYGTPGSAYTGGSLTPGASSLLRPTGSFGSALGSRLNKSFSTSNLRGESAASEGRSLLRPSAFSPEGTPGRYSNGNVRKLKIDRSLRTDLFGPEPKAIEAAKEGDAPSLRKRVSFDSPAEQSSTTPEANSSNALVRTEDQDDEQSPSSSRPASTRSQSANKGPEMEQVNSALTTVPEDAEAPRSASAPAAPASKAPAEKNKKAELGDYWTKPAIKDLKNMSRQQLKNVGNFVVGREGVGRIEFGSVDLTNTPLEDICGSIVQLNPRSATVYQDDQDKPAQGKALNVPSTIYLEHSWPRSHGGRKPVNLKSGKEYDRHIARLKRVGGTQFQKYDPETGVWCFKVEHFTTYGLDDDEDESEFGDDSRMEDVSSPLSEAPEDVQTPTGQQDMTLESVETETGPIDDTFQFKLDRRSQLSLPGGFGSEGMSFVDDFGNDESIAEDTMMSGGLGDANMEDSFISGGAVQAPSPGAIERYHSSVVEDDQDEDDAEQEMPGSFVEESKLPRSILKPSTGLSAFASPEKLAKESWEEQLQRTMSPKKRDRQALKDMQQSLMRATGDNVVESPFKQSMLSQSMLGHSYLAHKSAKKGKTDNSGKDSSNNLGKSQAFRTAMDLMDSMYAKDTGRKATAGAKGFEFPHPKKPRLSASDDMTSNDASWHESFKPKFTTKGTLVYAASGPASQVSGDLSTAMAPLVGEHADIRFARFTTPEDLDSTILQIQAEHTSIDISSGFPLAQAPDNIIFSSLAERVENDLSISQHEKIIWRLCGILYDPVRDACPQYLEGVPEDQIDELSPRIQMDALGDLWSELVAPFVQEGLKRARTAEEKALLYLTQNDIVAACDTLVKGKSFKLATLISQLPGTRESREMMSRQIDTWRERNDWSEMSDAVRALYSILAGQLWIVEGKKAQKIAPEDRVADFDIAERFQLNWKQTFALTLFFGGLHSLGEVVHGYLDYVHLWQEDIQPTTTWPNGVVTRDVLIELLRSRLDNQDTSKLFEPLTVSGSAFNTRLVWQLTTLMDAAGHCSVTTAELDQLHCAFATEFENAGSLNMSSWVLLHISDHATRENAVTLLLSRHGDRVSSPSADNRGSFEGLTQDNQIPAATVWRAKALYAKGGLHDPGLQTEWLLRAGDVDAAHEILCTEVGPQAVIARDHEWLSILLKHFNGRKVDGWQQGGQAFADYLKLARARQSKRQSVDEEAAVRRLRRGLAIMDDGTSKKSLEERVATIEMEKVLHDFEEGERDEEMIGREQPLGGRGIEIEMLQKYQRAMGVVV